jgi:2-polyprenyl-3-methyl-5-hydroxy-6-metoxy-1,4-benzoquinol methylase
MDLSKRDEQLRELMDDPHCDPQRLHATLRRFGLVNKLVSGWDSIYRSHVRGLLAGLDRPARVLDLGSGGGDVIAQLARLAYRDGLSVEWTGADPDPRAHDVASRTEVPHSTFICADADDLLAQGARFDLVISNHVLHHLEASELQNFAATSQQLAGTAVLHNDIARSRLAYALYSVGISPLAAGTFLRVDGLRSIRRSYQPAELSAALGAEWTVTSPAAFRLVAQGPGRA